MSESRVPAGVPTGGQFAASTRAEATVSPLVAGRADPHEVLAVVGVADRLCARAQVGGHVLAAEDYADVAFEMRDRLPLLDDAAFDTHMGTIARAALFVSTAEAAEDTDTEAYAEAAAAAGIEESDYPVPPEEAEPGDGYLDCAAYKAAVIEHWDGEIFRTVQTMVAENGAAKTDPQARRAARPA